jgi:hypothetical protein
MITVSEKTPPIFSYENILKNPLTVDIFEKTLSQLGIEWSTKESLISEFTSTINNFENPTYTGDISHFKVNLYTTLSDTNKNINLIDVLSTEEFIAKSTEAIENLISISLTDDNVNVSLEEYVKMIRKKGHGTPHILPVLRWLYRLEPNWQIHRDTSELIAAIKKHLIVNSTNDSTQELSSLVEENKQNKVVMREDELHYDNIKFYTKNLPESSSDYVDMINKIESALEYFSNSTGYKKEKLDSLMYNFIIHITKHWLSEHWKRYWYLWADIFSIEYQEKLDINHFVSFLNKYPEYKNLVINIINEKIIKLEKDITHRKEKIKTFYRPTREERCRMAPYRWAPIKSDQEYERELGNLRLSLDTDEKNLNLIKSYTDFSL